MGGKCTRCGEKMATGSKFCVSCGTSVHDANVKCIHCGAAVTDKSRFCTSCGKQVAGVCPEPGCNAELTPGARFCPNGHQLVDETAHTRQGRWSREPGVFAHRFEAQDLGKRLESGVRDPFAEKLIKAKDKWLHTLIKEGYNTFWQFLFGHTFAIEEGTRGVFFQNGKMIGVLEPGAHGYDDLPTRLSGLKPNLGFTVLFVSVADVELPIQALDLRTKDEQKTNALISLVLRLEDPLAFFINIMQGREMISNGDLSERMRMEVESILQPVIVDCGVDELYGNHDLKMRMEDELNTRLTGSLERYGLKAQQIQFVRFSDDQFEEIREIRSDNIRQGAKNTAELRRAEVVREHQLKYANFDAKVREGMTDVRMQNWRTKEDYRQFLMQMAHEADVKDILRKNEFDELVRQYDENKEDHDKCREHVNKTLDIQRARDRLADKADYVREDIKLQGELGDLADMKREQAIRDKRERKLADIELEEKEAESDIRRDMKEAEAGLQIVERMKATKQKEKDEEQRRKQEWLSSLNNASLEALVAAADTPEQAAVLGELKKTEILKGMTEEQILAMAAEKSDAVSLAFAEKFKSSASEETQKKMEELAERRLEDMRDSNEKMAEMQKENARMLMELMQTALKTNRDVATDAAKGTGGPSVIYPPAGSGAAIVSGSVQPSSSPRQVACSACGTQAASGSAFCPECGNRF